MPIAGRIQGLGNYYIDGVERQEIWIYKAEANGLPHREGIALRSG